MSLQNSITPARIGVGRSGTRPRTMAMLSFRADHALARDAVHSELSNEFLSKMQDLYHCPIIQTLCTDRQDFVLNPPKGKRANSDELAKLDGLARHNEIQIVISDGLSAMAVEANIFNLLPVLMDGLKFEKISFGSPVIVKNGRVAIADQICHHLGARLAINLIGERPGLSSACSLSSYITLNAGPNTISSDRTVVSNIHEGGTNPLEAGAYIVELCKRILKHNLSGVKFQQLDAQ